MASKDRCVSAGGLPEPLAPPLCGELTQLRDAGKDADGGEPQVPRAWGNLHVPAHSLFS